MANDSGIGDWLGKLGLGTTVMAILAWAAQVDMWIVPLVLWLLALQMRVRGTHFARWPELNKSIDDLTTTGDLLAAFHGKRARNRLRVLFEARGRGSRAAKVQAATQALDRGLAKWFGDEVLSPTAFNRSLTFAVVYPIVLLLLVWLVSGQSKLGTAAVLPADWTFLQRLATFLIGLVEFAAVVWCMRAFLRASGWQQWLYPGLAIGAVAVAGAVAGAVAVAFVVAVAVAVAGAGAGAVAFVVVGASAGAGAGAVADAVSGAVAVAVAVGFNIFQERVADRLALRHPAMGVALLLVSWLALFALVAGWLPVLVDERRLSADGPVFLFFFFLGVVPLWNATLDLASVALTRLFLRRYLRTGDGWWWMIAADLLLATAGGG